MPTAVRKLESDIDGSDKRQSKRSKRHDNNESQNQFTSLQKFNITTSEQLVKALKGGQSSTKEKVVIAESAWRDVIVPIPRKEFLLAEWLLDTLNREARNLKDLDAFESANVWNLLLELLHILKENSKIQFLARYPCIAFLHALGNVIARSGDERIVLDLVQPAVNSISLLNDNNVSSIDILTKTLSVWLDVVNRYASQDNCNVIAIPISLLVRAWIAMSKSKKSKQILTDKDILSSFCAALKKTFSLPHDISAHLRSYLCRLSYDSFSPTSRAKVDYGLAIEQLKSIPNSDYALTLFLQQRCLYNKNTASLSEQVQERLEIWKGMASHFLEIAIGDQIHTSTLASLLKIVSEENLYPSDQEDATNFLLQTLERALSGIEQNIHNEDAFECICLIQRIDESLFDNAYWERILSSLALSSPSISTRKLLRSILDSYSRTRTLDSFVKKILVGSLDRIFTAKHSSKEMENLVLQGTLFDSDSWDSFIGPSMSNFVSIEQSHSILDTISDVLSNLLTKPQNSVPHLGLVLQFSGQIISVIAIPEPGRREAALKLGLMYRNQILPSVKASFDQRCPERASSGIFAIECILRRLDSVKMIEAPPEWSRLMEELQSSQSEYLLPLHQIPVHPPLQIQMLVAVLERCNRDFSKARSMTFSAWLEDFFLGDKIDFNSVETIHKVRSLSQIVEPAYAALDIVFSAYMPVLERCANEQLLERLASLAKNLAKKYPDCSLATSLLINSANFELPRWIKYGKGIKMKEPANANTDDENVIAQKATGKLGTSLSDMMKNFDHLLAVEGAQTANVLYAPTFVQCVRQVSLEEYKAQLDKVQIEEEIPSSLPLLLCNGPEGSLSIAQNALDILLANLVGLDAIATSTVQKLEAIAKGKTVLFRTRQISPLLVLFTRTLENEDAISSILATMLIFTKLRPETLAPLLPQVSLLMGRILSHFHGNAYQKGVTIIGEQKIVQAREYTRLCSAITSRQSNLARGFSLHTLPIIVSYVRALTSIDGIGIGEIRQELERGMFTLCGILATWQRDSLFDMMSDDAERIIARKLWRNFEAQRYKGE